MRIPYTTPARPDLDPAEVRRYLLSDDVPNTQINPWRHPWHARALKKAAASGTYSSADVMDNYGERGHYLKATGVSGLKSLLEARFGAGAADTPAGKQAMATYVLSAMRSYSIADGLHRYVVDGRVDWSSSGVAEKLARGEPVSIRFQNLIAYARTDVLGVRTQLKGGVRETKTTVVQTSGANWEDNAHLSGSCASLDAFLAWLPRSHNPVLPAR